MTEKHNHQKIKGNSIARRIRSAMVKSSTICLSVLGVVSLLCMWFVSKSIITNDMTEIAQLSATMVSLEIQGMKDITYEIGCNPLLLAARDGNFIDVMF